MNNLLDCSALREVVDGTALRSAGAVVGCPSVQYANPNCGILKVVDLEVRSSFCDKEGMDFVLHDNYKDEIHPSADYRMFLEELGFDSDEADGEMRGYHSFKHSKNRNMVYFPNVIGKRLNSWRWNKSIRNIASRKLRKIELVGIKWVGSNVLTFPRGVSDMMISEPVETEKLCRKAGEIFYKKLSKSLGGNIGCQMNFHPWSSKYPLKPHCHLHFDFLGAIVRKKILHYLSQYAYKNDQGQGVPFDIILWRDLWVQALMEVFPAEKLVLDSGLELTCGNVDTRFHWEAITKENKNHVLNRFKYRDRRPLLDLSVFYRKNIFSGILYPIFCKYLVEYDNTVRTFGFWNKLKTFMPDSAFELVRDKKRYSYKKVLKKPEITCPVCNDRIVYCGLVHSLPENVGIIRITKDSRMLYSYTKEKEQRWLNEYLDNRTDEERLLLMNHRSD